MEELMWAIINLSAAAGAHIYVSLYNAFIVELPTAIRSMITCIYWLSTGCTTEWTIEDEDGNIIHEFPQINFED